MKVLPTPTVRAPTLVGVLHEASVVSSTIGTVVADLGGVVQASRTMVGSRRAALAAAAEVRSRRSTRRQHELQELGVAQGVLPGQGEPLGQVSRLRPSFKRRSSDRSSVETFGAAWRPSAPTSPDGELAWVSGKAAGHELACTPRARLCFAGAHDHPGDQPHVDRLGLERLRAGGSTRSGPHFLTRPTGVDLAHLGHAAAA